MNMPKNFLPISIVVAGIILALGVLFGQGVLAQGFGFDKNIQHRKSADAESVAGCMLSCSDMLAGWLEMNPDSKNYIRQQEKIAAKSQQCLMMNELAGFPLSPEEILASCGIAPSCIKVSKEEVHSGACGDISFIQETNLPQCCSLEGGPSGDLLCGAEGEWVVGVAAFPVCYIPGS
ncbi:MAG: hypothetical protein G01um101424_291 [Parcubacteria group bacterium Gr01-1014_24]|nr:MAG: hypothetical protein G01um101424_291 [Parcubacteria group bacterium Gr01-1014_24]